MLSSKQKTATPDICGDQSDTMTAPASEYTNMALCTNIRELPLKDFIACQVDNNLSVLGTGTDMQLQAAWMRLLSQYHEVTDNPQAKRYVELVAGMQAIIFRAAYIDFLLAALSELYTPSIADLLRKEHPDFSFSRETYLNEITYVQNKEKRHKIEYDNLKSEFDRLEKDGEQKARTRLDYIELLFDINQHEGSDKDENVSMEWFAIGVKRLQRHYKMLEEQAERNRH